MKILIFTSGLIPIIALIAIGIAIKYKKAYWLISGYNRLSEEKKSNVDIEGLGKLTANACFVIAFQIAVMFLFILLDMAVFSLLIVALIVPVIIFALVKGQKYDGNARTKDGKMRTSTKAIIGGVIGIFVAAIIVICVMMYYSSKPAEFTLENNVLKISGMYGESINLSEISSVDIVNTLPKILTKTNGSGIGSMYKGYFKLRDIGDAKLFVDAGVSPFIYIKHGDKLLIINCNDGSKTQELYVQLKREVQKNKKS